MFSRRFGKRRRFSDHLFDHICGCGLSRDRLDHFPVHRHLEVHELLKVARGLADGFDDARKRLNAVAEKIESCHRALNETNRALQWIVDEKGKER